MPKSLLVPAVFAALVGCGAALAAPAPGIEICAVTAPRFEPKPPRRPAPETARFLGGGKISHPVAAPCLQRAGQAEV